MRTVLRVPTLLSGGDPDAAYQAAVLGLSPIAYWPLTETSGTTADNAEGTAARDGTYNGVTLNSSTGPFGGVVGLWDGANDYCDVYSASLNSVFNGSLGSLSCWLKVSAASVWSDGTQDFGPRLAVDTNNGIWIAKNTTTNQMLFQYRAGGISKDVTDTSLAGTTDWFHVGATWNKAGDEMKAYINGAQVGSTLNSLGVYSGNLNSGSTVIGAFSVPPAATWKGYIAHVAVFDAVVSMSALYNGGPI